MQPDSLLSEPRGKLYTDNTQMYVSRLFLSFELQIHIYSSIIDGCIFQYLKAFNIKLSNFSTILPLPSFSLPKSATSPNILSPSMAPTLRYREKNYSIILNIIFLATYQTTSKSPLILLIYPKHYRPVCCLFHHCLLVNLKSQKRSLISIC